MDGAPDLLGWIGENRQRHLQMRGFFPFDFAQGQKDELLCVYGINAIALIP